MREPGSRLLHDLTRELFQTETSAVRHCRREAARLGSIPPAWALTAVADHAALVLVELPEVAKNHGLPVSGGGMLTGKLFSVARQLVLDRVIEAERSYRGTLLGIRHGVDLVTLLHHAAAAQMQEELAHWCWHWLGMRSAMMERVESELVWFASHPVEATRRAHAVAGAS